MIKKVLLLVLCSVNAIGQINKTMKRMPDTGQTSSFTSTFGEDHDYTTNAPYFIHNMNGTVTDTITGLMWQQTDGGELTIQSAILYCDTLTLGGYSNWRLPNDKESVSILNHQFVNPALDTNIFTKTNAEYWWTSKRQANDTNKIWSTNAGGGIGNHPQSETISAGGTKRFHVRAVRDLITPPIVQQRFSFINNMVMDSLTQLQWNSILSTDSVTWEEALHMADTSTYASHTDWRLPNCKELFSLSDIDLVNPCMSATLFSNLTLSVFWSSTTLINQPSKAWIMDNKFGITTYKDKLQKSKVMLVRDGTSMNTVITETPSHAITCYPNPFTSQIKLSGIPENLDCILYDIYGTTVYHGNALQQLDVSYLSKGIYLVEIPSLGAKIKLQKQ